jgi:hypothetical protein
LFVITLYLLAVLLRDGIPINRYQGIPRLVAEDLLVDLLLQLDQRFQQVLTDKIPVGFLGMPLVLGPDTTGLVTQPGNVGT